MNARSLGNTNDSDLKCYKVIYDLFVQCGACEDPQSYALTLLSELEKICYYDDATVFFLDASGKVYDDYSVNVSDEWIKAYLDYYVKTGDCPEEFSIYTDMNEKTPGRPFSRLIEWDDYPQTDFVRDYVRARGLRHSLGFCLVDMNGVRRVVYSLNRTKDIPFSHVEQLRMELAIPVLNDLYRKFFYQSTDIKKSINARWEAFRLTSRESEIANLLCQGMTVQNISAMLCISKNTTYKHISHIYEKVGVSSQQELLVKMFNKRQQ